MTQTDSHSDDDRTELQPEQIVADELVSRTVEAVENDERLEILDYEVDKVDDHFDFQTEVRVEFAVRENESVGLEELETDVENLEIRIGGKGGGSPFASLSVTTTLQT